MMADLAMQLQVYAICHHECLFPENPGEGVLLRNAMHHFAIGLMGVIRGQFAKDLGRPTLEGGSGDLSF